MTAFVGMGKDTIEICSKTIVWQFDNDYGWSQFDPRTSEIIEKAYQSNPKGSVTVTVNNGQTYKITFHNMKQENTNTHNRRSIQRKEQKSSVRHVDVSELRKLFEKYSKLDENEERGIGGEGIMKFAEDAGVDPMQIDLLVLFWKLNLTQKYFISEHQWIYGMAELGMETMSKIKAKLPRLKEELNDQSRFTAFYNFCFSYMKEPDQKNLPVDVAVSLWKLIMKGRYKYIDQWVTFIENQMKHSISSDIWSQFLEFTRDTSFSFDKFDPALSAYHSVIDEFIEYMQKTNKK